MSSEEVTTRSRILQATLSLIERGNVAISMSTIAKEAGLSRQALYLTFADKADLFIAALRFADGRRGIVQEQACIRAAKTGTDALVAIVDLQARLSPAYKRLADAFELLRRQDAAAEKAWQDRQQDRLEGCRIVAARISAEGDLRADLTVEAAADLIWSTTSSTVWDDLVVKRGWNEMNYRTHLVELLLSWLKGSS
ncbi:TetR/AcrR family transcriptional regulator [Sphingomonas oleivorans]|uniref:TetR/AcrR family transcriptional regulator n=1 Tax=Sphingomonas oleivorans TaxID=1735121 RepID=UPI002435D934|nr:TetR/AcrR family transcriptional regulator [Sphingomonas oleivorans]